MNSKPYFATRLIDNSEISVGDVILDIVYAMDYPAIVEKISEDGETFITHEEARPDYKFNIKKKDAVKLSGLYIATNRVCVGDDDIYVEPAALRDKRQGLNFKLIEVEELEGGYELAYIEYLSNPHLPDSVGKVREWPYRNIWKVVGRISPEAVWVKSGDTFSEEEIRIRKICHDDSCPPYDSYCSHCGSSRTCENDEGDEVLILNPSCKHFH